MKSDKKSACAYLLKRTNWTYISWEEGEALTGLVRAIAGVEEMPLPKGGTKKWSLLGARIFGTTVVVYAALANADIKHPGKNYTKATFDLVPCG